MKNSYKLKIFQYLKNQKLKKTLKMLKSNEILNNKINLHVFKWKRPQNIKISKNEQE